MNGDGIMGYPDIVGKDAALQNLGEVSNRGVDIELSWNDKIGKDFRYYIRPNLTFSVTVWNIKRKLPQEFLAQGNR